MQVLPVLMLVMAFEARALNNLVADFAERRGERLISIGPASGCVAAFVWLVLLLPLVVPIGFLAALWAVWNERDNELVRVLVLAAYLGGTVFAGGPLLLIIGRSFRGWRRGLEATAQTMRDLRAEGIEIDSVTGEVTRRPPSAEGD